MRLLKTIAALLLAGCAAQNAPNALIEQGAKTTHWTDRAPADAAACIARNVEAASPDLFGTAVHRGRGDRIEVSIGFQNPKADYALVRIEPVAGGTAITMWRTSSITEPDGGWPGRFMDGC